jgi:hypothetical protein
MVFGTPRWIADVRPGVGTPTAIDLLSIADRRGRSPSTQCPRCERAAKPSVRTFPRRASGHPSGSSRLRRPSHHQRPGQPAPRGCGDARAVADRDGRPRATHRGPRPRRERAEAVDRIDEVVVGIVVGVLAPGSGGWCASTPRLRGSGSMGGVALGIDQ